MHGSGWLEHCCHVPENHLGTSSKERSSPRCSPLRRDGNSHGTGADMGGQGDQLGPSTGSSLLMPITMELPLILLVPILPVHLPSLIYRSGFRNQAKVNFLEAVTLSLRRSCYVEISLA